jgi:hypothetical protein
MSAVACVLFFLTVCAILTTVTQGFQSQECVCHHDQRGVVVPAHPVAHLIMIQPEFFFQLLIVLPIVRFYAVPGRAQNHARVVPPWRQSVTLTIPSCPAASESISSLWFPPLPLVAESGRCFP